MISNDDVIRTIDTYCERFPHTEKYIRDLRQLLINGAPCLSRKEFRGHVTCSALVMNADSQVLMIHHRTLDRWLLPGGHVEVSDISLPAAAMRELSEEVGVAFDQICVPAIWAEAPVHIDRHTIPTNPAKGEPAHEHWDFCYRLECNAPITEFDKGEVLDVRWCPLQELPERFAPTIATTRVF